MTTTEIGKEAFYFATELEEIALPEGLVSVGDLAFRECPELQSVTLPESVKNIGSNAYPWSTVRYTFRKLRIRTIGEMRLPIF